MGSRALLFDALAGFRAAVFACFKAGFPFLVADIPCVHIELGSGWSLGYCGTSATIYTAHDTYTSAWWQLWRISGIGEIRGTNHRGGEEISPGKLEQLIGRQTLMS